MGDARAAKATKATEGVAEGGATAMGAAKEAVRRSETIINDLRAKSNP